eukprot:EG_transcript_6804
MSSQAISLTSYTEFPEVQAAVCQKLLVMAHLKAPEMHLPEGKERPPISVSAVIDKSGSMSGGKLELTKATLRFVVANLTDKDEFGLIVYSSNVQEALSLQKMDAQGRKRALQAVDGIQADGCTNLSGGLFAGIDQLKGLPFNQGDLAENQAGRRFSFGKAKTKPSNSNSNSNSNASFSLANVMNSIPNPFRRNSPPPTQVPHQVPVFQQQVQQQAPIQFQQVQQQVTGWQQLPVPTVALLIGNECDSASSDPTTAPWVLFVRLDSTAPGAVEDYVAKVEFELPAAGGAAQRLTVPTAPFQLSRTGHAAADVRVHVTLGAAHGSATHAFQYTPNFASPVTYTTVQVPLPGAGGQPADPIPPLITATPPSQPAADPAPRAAAGNEVVAVWLFTDGLANEGIQDREQLVQATKDRLQGMTPACNVFTFGFGADHDAQLLKDVADAGHGMYYFVENEGAIARSFADCLGGLMSVVAKGIKLTATLAAGVTVHRVFTKFEHERSPTLAWVKIADLYSEEERDIILEIEVPVVDPPTPTPAAVLEWRLEYQNLLTEQADTVVVACLLARPVEAKPCPPHPLLDQQRNRVRCTDAIEEAKRLADQHKLPDARALLQKATAGIDAS